MTGPPRIDVVILTWNDGDLLAQAIDSALASEGVDVRVIVVDNGSDPAATVPADDRVRLIRNDANRGVAPARNQGARAGQAEFVCLLDSDARLLPGSLLALVAPLRQDGRVALAGPVFTGQAPEASAGRAPTLARKAGRLLGRYDTYAPIPHAPGAPWWPVDFTIGACQLIRRCAFQAVGGLDDSIFYGPEDVDFCLRLMDGGWAVVQVAGAGCHHPPRRTSRRIVTKRAWKHGWQVVRHLWRHRNPVVGVRHGAS